MYFTRSDIDRFVAMLKKETERCVLVEGDFVPIGFVLHNANTKREVTFRYCDPITDFYDLSRTASSIRSCALRTGAEAAGCVFRMDAAVVECDINMPFALYGADRGSRACTEEAVMIHVDHLYEGMRFWYAPVKDDNGVRDLGEFTELRVMPSPDNPSFLPLELYGTVAQA
jgi:hypothetical protein